MLLADERLAALGYEPAGFTRAAEALAEFRADPQRFDMVALDHLMPGMTGIELAKQLRMARPPATPVLSERTRTDSAVGLPNAQLAGLMHMCPGGGTHHCCCFVVEEETLSGTFAVKDPPQVPGRNANYFLVHCAIRSNWESGHCAGVK